MGLWECGNPAPDAGFPKRGGRAFGARPRRWHFHSPGQAVVAEPIDPASGRSRAARGGPPTGGTTAEAWPAYFRRYRPITFRRHAVGFRRFDSRPTLLCRRALGPFLRYVRHRRFAWRSQTPSRTAASLTFKVPAFTRANTSIRFSSRTLIRVLSTAALLSGGLGEGDISNEVGRGHYH